jgi:hydrogenase 3 maturation protease
MCAGDDRRAGAVSDGEKTPVKKRLVLTVGNGMMGDDAAGPLLAQTMQRAPVGDWDVLDGASVPENCLHLVREMAPDQVLVVDAADMDLAPGEVRLLDAEGLNDPFLTTTHTLPLLYLVQALREIAPKVDLLGIQPRVVAFGYPVSPEVQQAVRQVYESLERVDVAWDRL